jgi:hypothetical protein
LKEDSVVDKGVPLTSPVADCQLPIPAVDDADLAARIRAVRDEIVAQLKQLPPSGLKTADSGASALAASYEEEVDASDDDSEE